MESGFGRPDQGFLVHLAVEYFQHDCRTLVLLAVKADFSNKVCCALKGVGAAPVPTEHIGSPGFMITGFLLTIGFPELAIIIIVMLLLFGGAAVGLLFWRGGRKRDDP